MTTRAPEKAVRKSNRIATLLFRIIVGAFGLVILGIAIRFKLYAESWKAFATFGAFCGLLLGYAFGGDKWGLGCSPFLPVTTFQQTMSRENLTRQHRPTRMSSNQSLQLTAGRSDASQEIMKTRLFQSTLAPASGS